MFCLFLFRHKLNNSKCPRSPQAAALAMDESILDADQVENLIKFCPTKEEMELLKVKLYLKLLIVHVFCQCHLQWDYFLFVCVRDNIFVLCRYVNLLSLFPFPPFIYSLNNAFSGLHR